MLESTFRAFFKLRYYIKYAKNGLRCFILYMSFNVYQAVQFDSYGKNLCTTDLKNNPLSAFYAKEFNLSEWCAAIKSQCLLESILEYFLEVIFALLICFLQPLREPSQSLVLPLPN